MFHHKDHDNNNNKDTYRTDSHWAALFVRPGRGFFSASPYSRTNHLWSSQSILDQYLVWFEKIKKERYLLIPYFHC